MLLSAKVLLSSFPLGSKSPLVCQKMSKWCTFFVQDVLRASKNWTMKMLFRSVHMALLETLCRIYMYLHSLSLRLNAFGSADCILVKKEAALCQSSQKPRARANGVAKRSRGPPLSLDHYSSFAPSQPVRRSSSASVL